MQTNILKLILSYLRSKLAMIFTFLLFALIFVIIFSLYNLEIEAILYVSIFCVIIGAIMIILNFINYYKKHKMLVNINKNVNILSTKFENSINIVETDYQEIIKSLNNLKNKAITDLNTQRTESINYYTTWVHQIKTPISVMRMIMQGNDTPENIELSAELFKIEQYVDMVLCYFRLDNSSSDFVFKKVNLDKIIKQSIRKYAPQFIRKRIKLVYEPTSVAVLSDEKWLAFVIEQILSNAVKYTNKGAISITVENNVLCIKDTGIGISPEDLPRIFEKGYSGYNGRTDKKATGLGLFLCNQASKKLSHKMSAKSEIGKGTSIFIDLNHINLEIE